jgi:hypothetical protein
MAFDYIEFHKNLHNSMEVDPQFAELKEKEVIYAFFVRPAKSNSNTGIVSNGTHKNLLDVAPLINSLDVICDGNIKTRVVGQELISNSLLKKDYNLEKLLASGQVQIKDAYGRPNSNESIANYLGEIVVTYVPKSEEEFKNIAAYLRTVKTDDGSLPKPDETFFGYD